MAWQGNRGTAMIRRYGEPVKAGQRYRRRPGVYAVLLRGESILATIQAGPEPEFQLPGGGIDKGEQPIAALHREVMEETGWRIRVTRRLGAFRRFTFMPEYDLWAEKVCTVYLAQPIRRLGPPSEPGHSAIWLPVWEAGSLLGNAGDCAMLRRAMLGHGPI
jgi:8-oxo-dGTP diphosphatase